MCRYARKGPYKDRYACFDCRKAFKRRKADDPPKGMRPRLNTAQVVRCPECGQPMRNMGMDFKAPPQSDVRQWEKVRLLFAYGFTFHSSGWCGPGLRPSELREVQAFLDDQLPKSEGQILLRKIASRQRDRAKHRRGRPGRVTQGLQQTRLWGPVRGPFRPVRKHRPKSSVQP